MKHVPVVILGGGYGALGAADALGRAGVSSLIIEAAPSAGGLATCVQVGPVLVEGTYHHIKPHETTLIDLINDLGLGDRLIWKDTRMGFYTGGEMYPFSTPRDLLGFKPFNLVDKFRFGLGVVRTKYSPSESVDGLNARDWIMSLYGRRVHDRMLGPMLHNKFGLPSSEISAAFLHGRIRGIAKTKANTGSGELMGYLSGSLQPLTDRLEARVRKHAEIRYGTSVAAVLREGDRFTIRTSTGETVTADRVINTLPLEIFEKIERNFPFHSEVEYQSAICGIFVIREKLTDLYWTNIIDERVPFKVLVNQSRLDDYPGTVVYCGNYLRSTAELYQQDEAEITRRYLAGLRLMFGEVTVEASRVFKARYATPIYDRHFAARTEGLQSCVPGMKFAGNIAIYPHGRTVSNVLKSGYEAAAGVLEGLAVTGRSPA
jgi:protoporphyrinogen oxidase